MTTKARPETRTERWRWCRGCQTYKPQKPEFGFGSVWGLITVVCGDCRFPDPPDPARINPRFIAELDLTDMARFALAAELDNVVRKAQAAAASFESLTALTALANAARAGGTIDIDATGLTQERREAVEQHLRNTWTSTRGPVPTAAEAFGSLLRAWASWTDETRDKRPRVREIPRIVDPDPETGLPASEFRDVEVSA
ncbi:MAG TPA: hypothetical protein VGS60_07910 [Actinomycetes bacterium]|nr:hypothetical protein [Actinomycetes bacterium]